MYHSEGSIVISLLSASCRYLSVHEARTPLYGPRIQEAMQLQCKQRCSTSCKHTFNEQREAKQQTCLQ